MLSRIGHCVPETLKSDIGSELVSSELLDNNSIINCKIGSQYGKWRLNLPGKLPMGHDNRKIAVLRDIKKPA